MKLKFKLSLFLSAFSLFPALAQEPAQVAAPDSVASETTPALGHLKAQSPAPMWLQNAVIYEANLRQGTSARNLKGLQNELPRLRDLGVDVIWLMPIHPISQEGRKGTLGSYYAVQDYKAVNPEFGTLQDLKELVNMAHSLGMKVILDEVCNHTGVDHPWVKEHPEYYARNEKGEMFGPYDWTDVYKLDYSNPELRAAMVDALKYWLIAADIDGYRCDVAGEVPTDFWEEARPQLQSVKPVLMLAEASKPELLVKSFDVDYAWPMKDVFNAIALTQGINEWGRAHREKRPESGAADIPALIERQKKEYPQGAIHMNMITNHDLNSWEGTEFDRFGKAVETFAVLSYTLPGVPMMYTGQEVGFNHAFEFFEKDPVTPKYLPNKFTSFYKKLNELKHTNAALAASAPVEFIETDNPEILTFVRRAEDNSGKEVVVIANLTDKTAEFMLPDDALVEGTTDFFTGKPAKIPSSLRAWQYLLLVK